MTLRIPLAAVATALGIAACGAPTPSSAAPTPKQASQAPGSLGSEASPTDPVDFTKCATDTAVAQAKPVYLVFMFDESGSMGFDGKWPAATAATSAFFSSTDSAGVSASMSFFPFFPASDPQNYSCDASEYTTPLVPMAPLPSADLAGALTTQTPNGATPTYVALNGAINYAQSIRQGQGQDGTVAIVLVTDGLPDSECSGNSLQDVTALAASVANQGLLTYVIGVGPQLTRLHDIASAGGTTNAFIVDTQNPDQIKTDLLNAMTSIRFQLACDYAIPPPPAGQAIAPDLVNVQYKPQGGDPAKPTTFVNSQTCADPNGWRYDNPANPSRILLCGSSCQAVKAKPGEVDILFGCQTKYGAVK